MREDGRLAIWNNCATGHEAEYETWYQGEHLRERVGIPGFLRGRRYQAIDGALEYFTYYETTSPEILTSTSYLSRGNSPTPLTRKIMSGIFTDMNRTVCRCQSSVGDMRGAYAVTVKRSQQADDFSLVSAIDRLTLSPGIARIEIWVSVESEKPTVSFEESLRGGDKKILGCVFVETLRERDARQVAALLNESLNSQTVEVGIYHFVCELARISPRSAKLA